MSDTETPDTVTLLDRVDGVYRGLVGLLEAGDHASYAVRPASGEWSIVENVRHLLFAQQLHLGKFLPDGFEWSGLGLAPHFVANEEAFSKVDTEPTDDIEAVFDAWDVIHTTIIDAVIASTEATPKNVQDHLDHLLYHFNIIKDLLKQQEGAA